MRRILYGLAVMLIVASPAFGTTVYKWVDREGVTNFTDDRSKVPSPYRGRVATQIFEETPATVPWVRPQITKTDIYGHDETWWKERVRPWKEELAEATTNYERVNQRFVERAEALSRMRFGSRTQVKMKIIDLDRANNERMKYEEQIAEATQVLEKLAKEAAESKADPAWLN